MAKRARYPVADRNRQLGRIHQAKKQLNLDDDTYRALLQRVTGKGSSADMTTDESNQVLREFARLGFKEADQQTRKRAYAGRPRNIADVPMLRKVEALLADAKRPWSYAHATAKRMFGRDRVEFLRHDELHKLVMALQTDAKRHGRGNG